MAGNIVRRVWWLVPVSVVAAAVVAVSGISYAFDVKNKACAEDFESVALSVSGVVTADFTCSSSFGNPSEKGTITLDAKTEEEAVAVMESVLRAYAETDMDNATTPFVDYVSEDGTIAVGPPDAGFNGLPSLRQIRDHYGLQEHVG
ncbi:hypothetical protein [Streptomyces capitiformicae]|uniref:Uncharacterized protein n=1 Tax=Streptomyces capitiformicae TaxID=2014920 RepID=A0A919DL48_9ACTN|nr:hypothetical protein [Streptomyces capitiformicae]GHE53503.1 hypothetical protein GCM10017771_75920 [Streptomyces capitiformicae]